MRIFVTGGSGYIGRGVLRALAKAGHRMIGLARSDGAAKVLRKLGADVVLGDLAEPERWRSQVRGHDAALHLAMVQGKAAAEIDWRTVEVLLKEALSDRGPSHVIYTSGVMVLGDTGNAAAGEEARTSSAAAAVAWRPAVERSVLEAATGRLVTAVVRPGMVYGGAAGLVAAFFETAAQGGASMVVGDGLNRWAPVHRSDLAALYLRLLEAGAGGIYHAVEERSERVLDIARRASELAGAKGAVNLLPLEAARAAMGPFADALCLDQVVAAERSSALGWRPSRRILAGGLEEAFEEWKKRKEEVTERDRSPAP